MHDVSHLAWLPLYVLCLQNIQLVVVWLRRHHVIRTRSLCPAAVGSVAEVQQRGLNCAAARTAVRVRTPAGFFARLGLNLLNLVDLQQRVQLY